MIQKALIIFLSILVLNDFCCSQERKDVGIQAGGSYYMGDYNYGLPLYQPSVSVGLIYRYNFNNFYSFRISGNYALLKGGYSTFNNYLPGRTGSFSKQLIESEVLIEMNFMPFNTKHLKKDRIAPYVFFGAGGAYISGEITPQLPFGIGVKYCPHSRITMGWEWRISKTFTDNIDNYNNVYDGSKAIFHNNDWYSFIGVFITYRIYNKNFKCPVYQ